MAYKGMSVKEYQHKYREDHAEEIAAQRKGYYQEHRGKILDEKRQYHLEHKAEHQKKDRDYAQSEKGHRRRSEYYQENKRKLHLKHTYGLSLEEFEAMLIAQEYRCSLCGIHRDDTDRGELCVDHDHALGKIRSLTCHRCNTVLGFANDNPELLEKMGAYLRYHSF